MQSFSTDITANAEPEDTLPKDGVPVRALPAEFRALFDSEKPATAGQGYPATSGTLTLNDGQQSKTYELFVSLSF